jgi:hypothetical protein
MAKRRKPASAVVEPPAGRVSAEEKIARLLGMLAVKDIPKKNDKVPLLRRAGFSVAEVASMLDMEENHVRVADHHGRKAKKKPG